MKPLLLLLFLLVCCSLAQAQASKPRPFSVYIGAHYNGSSTDWMPTTGIGLFVEPSLLLHDAWKLAYRFEPSALAYGVLVLPGGCGGECKEGANYVLGNYVKAEYLLGQPKFGNKGGRHQGYVGASLNLLTHRRWIITSRSPGRWTDSQKWVADLGMGLRVGAVLGRLDISAAYNIAGSDFQNFLGLSLGYRVLAEK